MGKLMGIKFQMIPWSYLMGNHMCRSGFISEPAAPSRAAAPIIKVIKSDGLVKIYDRPINVSALTLKFPKHKVCSSDSLYIGQKISALSEDDELQLGHTYFLLPIHFFQSVLTFVTVTSFAASKAVASSNCQLFEIQKTESGFLRIRVRDEFISRLMMMRKAEEDDQMITKMMMINDNNNSTSTGTGYNTRTNIEKEKKEENSSSSSSRKNKKNMMMSSSSNNSRVCTTPELQKEYKQLVLIGRRGWKPKLDMIKESRSSEKKSSISSSSSSSRKVLLIPASFRLKKIRSSGSSITSTTSAPTDNNNNNMSSSSSGSSSKSSSRSHKAKKKKSSLQSSSEPPPPPHHVPITSSTSTTTTATTKPPPAVTKHKVKSSKRVYS